MKKVSRIIAAVAGLTLTSFGAKLDAAPIVKDGDVVAIIGDSITEGRQYGSLIEDYLLMCQPAKVRVMQFGWGGETVGGFNNRMSDFLAMKPTVATTCYGMNDGGYRKVDDNIKKRYHDGLLSGVKALQASGMRVLVGSPGCVDSTTFRNPSVSPADYNANLAALTEEARAVAKETDSPFADVHTPMIDAMAASKTAFGPNYAFAGGDGIHPQHNGGLAMAYAFLKGMGFDGDLGTITVDLADQSAKATDGHTVQSVKDGVVTIDSTRYPFCFFGNPKDPGGTRGVSELMPFNKDLNRLTLVATGPAAKYKITWGKTEKTFTADQLKAGINLPAEFTDNPFVEPFMKIHGKVMEKQGSEILLLKQLLHSLNAGRKLMPGAAGPNIDGVLAALPPAEQKLSDDLTAEVKPVTHTLTIQPAE